VAAIERNHDVTQFDPMTVDEVKPRPGITIGFLAVVIAICLLIVILSSRRSTTNPAASHSAGNAASTDGAATFGPYMSNLQRSVKRGWFPPKGHESKRIVVQFKIYKDGSVDNLRIVTTSGVQLADEAALNAVRHATLQPLPEGAPASVDVQFTFDYNVFERK
jgi:TonB family protein